MRAEQRADRASEAGPHSGRKACPAAPTRAFDRLAPRCHGGVGALPPGVIGSTELPGALDHSADPPVAPPDKVLLEGAVRWEGRGQG